VLKVPALAKRQNVGQNSKKYMAIFDIFSKRQKKLRGEVPEIYIYDDIPNALRIQIVQIIKETIGVKKQIYNAQNEPAKAYQFIHKTLCKEYGIFALTDKYSSDETNILNFLLTEKDTERVLDVVELSFKFILKVIKEDFDTYEYYTEVELSPDESIEELNDRFKEHGIGYQFESGDIIKVDSTYIHNEITKPTLTLLWNKTFKGANEEYLKAHEHYIHGRNKECLTECLKAFESTMKIICTEKGWTFNQNDTARKLIQVCFQNNLVPPFTQNQFTSLQSLLESGIPTIRNKVGGHGQGQILQKVDDEMTRYGLNLAGTNIVFLVELSGIV
jgi:hypothetical protein